MVLHSSSHTFISYKERSLVKSTDQKDEKNGINITETEKYLSFKCMIRSNATMPF